MHLNIVLLALINLFTAYSHSAAISQQDQKKDDSFGSSEHFLPGKVVPSVVGSGNIHKVSQVTTVEHDKKEQQLNKLLYEIYSNFIKSPTEKKEIRQYHQQDVPTAIPPPIKPKTVGFQDLENAVDDLIKALSQDKSVSNAVKKENHVDDTSKTNDATKYSFKQVPTHDKTSVESTKEDSIPPATDKKLSFNSFKNKFLKTFVERDTKSEPLVESDTKSSNALIDDNKALSQKSVMDLYNELKKEVQDEKLKSKGKTEQQTPLKEDASVIQQQDLNTDHMQIKLEDKKKELVSLINTLLTDTKLVYDGKHVHDERQSNDVDSGFEKLYQSNGNVEKKETNAVPPYKFEKKQTSGERDVEKIFLDAFKRNMHQTNDEKINAINNVIEKQQKKKENDAKLKTINDFIVKKQEEGKAALLQEKKEELKNYLIEFIQTLNKRNSIKKLSDQVSNTNEINQTPRKEEPSSDTTRLENELEEIVSKSKQGSEITDSNNNTEMKEALKGFDISKRDVGNNLKRGRP